MSASNLTILLTLKDRAKFTRRWFDYARRVRLPFRIFVADGSLDDAAQQVVAGAPELDVQYVRYPPDTTYAAYYAKLTDALARIATPFVALADNDDFPIAECLDESVRFLSSNPDFAACGGQAALFWSDASGARWKLTDYRDSIEGETGRARLCQLRLRNGDPLFYYAKRTSQLREHYSQVARANLADLFLVEYLVLFLSAVAGKTRRLPLVQMARQQAAPGSSAASHQEAHGDALGRMLAPSWSGDFDAFATIVAGALAERDAISLEDARHWVVDAYRALMSPVLLHAALREKSLKPSQSLWIWFIRSVGRQPANSLSRRMARWMFRREGGISADFNHGDFKLSVPARSLSPALGPIDEILREAAHGPTAPRAR
jgi:glycosyltransferase domain-containing protein